MVDEGSSLIMQSKAHSAFYPAFRMGKKEGGKSGIGASHLHSSVVNPIIGEDRVVRGIQITSKAKGTIPPTHSTCNTGSARTMAQFRGEMNTQK